MSDAFPARTRAEIIAEWSAELDISEEQVMRGETVPLETVLKTLTDAIERIERRNTDGKTRSNTAA